MGSLYKRGETWWIKFYANGRPRRESARTTKRGEASRLLKDREGRALTGTLLLPNNERIQFREAADALIQFYATTGKRNPEEAKSKLKPVRAYFDAYRLPHITQAAIMTYIEKRQQEGLSNASINRETAILGKALRLAVESGLLLRMPKINRLKESAARSGFFERADFDKVLKQLQHRPDLVCALEMGFELGWRVRSEILSLKLSQLDLTEGTVYLPPGLAKTEQPRLCYLTPALHRLVSAQVERVKALARQTGLLIPYLFPSPVKGKRQGLPQLAFKKAWSTACRRAGLPHMLVHDLRRTAVRNLIRSGVPQVVAQQISGHRSLSIFNRYNIVNSDDLKAAAKKIAGHTLGTIAPLSASTTPLNPCSSSSSS